MTPCTCLEMLWPALCTGVILIRRWVTTVQMYVSGHWFRLDARVRTRNDSKSWGVKLARKIFAPSAIAVVGLELHCSFV